MVKIVVARHSIKNRASPISVNSRLSRNDYKKGFGNFLIRDFWLGLDKIYRLTQNKRENKLRVDLGVTAKKTVYAQYEWFGIENETNRYKLDIGSFSASSTVKRDSLFAHNGKSFSTWDRSSADHGCKSVGGGWWYLKGVHFSSNLNGIYPCDGTPSHQDNQIRWGGLINHDAEANQAPKRTEMKIRRKDFLSWVSGGEGFFKNCGELYKCGQTISGVYTIDLADGKGAFNVYCDQTTDGGGYTVIQKRVDDTVDFNRTWKDYKNGFASTVKRDSLSDHNGMLFSTWNRSSTDHDCTSSGGGWWYRKNCLASSNLNGIYPPNRTTNLGINQIRWGGLHDAAKDNQAPKRTEMKLRRNDFLSW
ncbi:angiopoietin-related protein 1-like, partial [Stylophora pistillata]|uniref:angiopoietin-related protein 1-like n=1 Tax=Stylophora pistillata TaxID=50429 RepID=UPI000C04E9E4